MLAMLEKHYDGRAHVFESTDARTLCLAVSLDVTAHEATL